MSSYSGTLSGSWVPCTFGSGLTPTFLPPPTQVPPELRRPKSPNEIMRCRPPRNKKCRTGFVGALLATPHSVPRDASSLSRNASWMRHSNTNAALCCENPLVIREKRGSQREISTLNLTSSVRSAMVCTAYSVDGINSTCKNANSGLLKLRDPSTNSDYLLPHPSKPRFSPCL